MKRILVLAIVLLSFSGNALAQEKESKKLDKPNKSVHIYYGQEIRESGVTFFMWIDGNNIMVKNTVPGFNLGYTTGLAGSLYIEKSAGDFEEMTFHVDNYEKGDRNFPSHIIVYFGGARPNDLHIRLPDGCTAEILVVSFHMDD